MVSPTSRIDGATGKTQVPRPMYSFRMSFCAVPRSRLTSKPRFSAIARYIAIRHAAAPLIVSDTVIRSRSMPSNATSKSRSVSTAMPTRPTSPSACTSSESMPHCVGRSNATFRPVWPLSIRNLKRRLVSAALPKPVYWRIVNGCLRYISGWMPRVNGYAPGSPSSARPPLASSSAGVYSGAISMPDSLRTARGAACASACGLGFGSGRVMVDSR
jgi:hypothetical protein